MTNPFDTSQQQSPPVEQHQQKTTSQGIEIPVDAVTLPSKGLLYPSRSSIG